MFNTHREKCICEECEERLTITKLSNEITALIRDDIGVVYDTDTDKDFQKSEFAKIINAKELIVAGKDDSETFFILIGKVKL